ncbi:MULTISPECIES: VOC family protein [unclassified Pseudoalteromonas]|jgi:extradiol dioxygenase family protein|uniref:VOC family protein n=1 Tax=unclassified Pseudoalteromonas TaxID=194690 RepID=UPI000731CDD0|nr:MULTISPECIES: VOC family protein [unclassified Pseudoalteromonas]KTD99110.1 glyoxalase [Pseudoalteromonas sp. H71]KTF19370.1 glyoxalase [Pseudoalteromonas sp. 10-33]MBW4964912.1 VOC family protein [Pseudoalteromonas sp. CR1]TMN86041.1 glyoxalase [Pseudoalteromonas sp. S410]TMN93367.1 glyoxalase [Pseudoalteromonas sp. S408]
MSNCLHLAIPAGDLEVAKTFYCDVLGCKTGNSEEGRWVDIDFWGNELTLHQSVERLPTVRHDVDMGAVAVPHFGIHLSEDEFNNLKKRIEDAGLEYLDKPYRRFVGDEFEQETFFIEDTNGNVLEMKTMVNPEVLFKKV